MGWVVCSSFSPIRWVCGVMYITYTTTMTWFCWYIHPYMYRDFADIYTLTLEPVALEVWMYISANPSQPWYNYYVYSPTQESSKIIVSCTRPKNIQVTGICLIDNCTWWIFCLYLQVRKNFYLSSNIYSWVKRTVDGNASVLLDRNTAHEGGLTIKQKACVTDTAVCVLCQKGVILRTICLPHK